MSLKFLIVDDSKAMQTIVKRILSNAGYQNNEFHFADNGKQALEEITSWQPDLVLLDWHMPEMSGIEVLKKVQALRIKTKIGLITAEKSEESLNEARKAGAIFIVNKPFTVEKLKESLIPTLAGVSPLEDVEQPLVKDVLFPTPSAMSILFSTITGKRIKVEKVARTSIKSLAMPCSLVLYGDENKNIRAVQLLDAGVSDRLAAAFAASVYGNEAFDDKLLAKSLLKALTITAVCFHSVKQEKELKVLKTYTMQKLVSKVASIDRVAEEDRLDLKFTFDDGEECHSIMTIESKPNY